MQQIGSIGVAYKYLPPFYPADDNVVHGSGSEVARRFNVDRSAISRATLRVSRDPELLSAAKAIQREFEVGKNNIETMSQCSRFLPNLRPNPDLRYSYFGVLLIS